MPEDGDGLYRAMGRVEGRLASLDGAFRDDRARNQLDHEKMAARLEVIEDKLVEAIEKSNTMQSQIYSNKHGIEGANEDLALLKTVYAKGLGAVAVLSLGGTLMFTGLWWALTHWSGLVDAVRALGKS